MQTWNVHSLLYDRFVHNISPVLLFFFNWGLNYSEMLGCLPL